MTLLTTLLVIMKYMTRPKSAAVKDIDIDIADMLGKKYCIDIVKGNIDPRLICFIWINKLCASYCCSYV